MDGYEATRMVFSRIQNIDPENASKIMGLLLIQDHGEKEMIRLAFGPETLLHSVILKARKELGLPSNSPTTPSTPSSQSPFLSTNPIAISRQSSAASRLMSATGASFSPPLTNMSSPSSSVLSTWGAALSDLQNRDDLIDPNGFPCIQSGSSSSIYGNGSTDSMIDEFQLQEQLSFLNDSSPPLGPNNPDLLCQQTDLLSSPTGWGGSVHRWSCSVSDVCLGSEDPCSGVGWKPCLYYARGFCKNGSTCRFLHGGLGDSGGLVGGADGGAPVVGSPSKMDLMGQCHEVLRSKSAQQQRLAVASQLLGSSTFPYSPKSMNLLLQQQQQQNDAQRAAAAAAAALMMGEDLYKFSRSRLERSEFSINGMVNPASRQIYLTFPADSTFREEDVSNYFSIYGPVQDVRIPYQQKRMFGFVTFVYPETVKLILAKGNPHFVCDARVLVKPYKEKGKVPDKKQQQQPMERGEFSPCGTPTGLDSRSGPFDLQLGARNFYNSQDILWRRKLEQEADLQQALEFQSQRLMNLQLLDVKKHHHHHHHRALSTGSPIPSPTQPSSLFNQTFVLPTIGSNQGFPEDNGSSIASPNLVGEGHSMNPILTAGSDLTSKEKSGSEKGSINSDDVDFPESLEHNLPDSPFASPTKGSSDYTYAFSNTVGDGDNKDAISASSSANNNLSAAAPPMIPATSAVDMAACKSFNCQIPRFSSGHGAIGMYAGASGPTYPVGV